MSQVTTVSTFQGQLRTVTEQSVLNSVASLMGLDPSSNLETNVASAYLKYIDNRTREAWEFFDWSELLLNEQRAFANSWDTTSTYTTGQFVFDWGNPVGSGTLLYYKALTSVPANTVVSNTTYWQSTSAGNINLPLPLVVPTTGQFMDQSKTLSQEIGTVVGVYSNDPYKNQIPVPIPWGRTAKGINIYPVYTTYAQSPIVTAGGSITFPYVNFNTVFILHRQAYPGFATDPFVSGTSYTVGNLVYYNTDTYSCIQNTSGSQLPTNTSFWTLTPFPYVLSEFVKYAVYADALAEDGQQEKSLMQLGDKNSGTGAYSKLWEAMDKQQLQQSLTQRYSVVVSGNW